MPSTYTDNLGLELQATGENDGTWGDKLNTVLTNVDTAICGLLALSVAGGSDVTLTAAQALHAVHQYSGALTANINVIVPTTEKVYYITNNTTGAYTLTVKTSAGTGIAVSQGETKVLYADGTNVIDLLNTLGITQITSTDPGAGAGPDFVLDRNSASPAANDLLGRLIFAGRDDSANQTYFAAVGGVIRDPVNASEDGDMNFYLMSAATLTKFMELLRDTAIALRIIDDGAGATAGPNFFLHRNSASPADNDLIGRIVFEGEDDGSNRTEYATIDAQILDVTDTEEDAQLLIKVIVAGSLTTILQITNEGLNLQDKLLIRPEIKDYGETVNAIGDFGGGTQDIDLTLGNVVTATVSTATVTFTFSNPPATGKSGSFTLILTNGGSQTVNWPASVDWGYGSAPTLTASGIDVLSFFTIDGGTTWYGFVSDLDMQ